MKKQIIDKSMMRANEVVVQKPLVRLRLAAHDKNKEESDEAIKDEIAKESKVEGRETRMYPKSEKALTLAVIARSSQPEKAH